MEKFAATEIEIHELIKKRWSPRAFSTKKIEKKSLIKILDAARWSASCFNEQPWRFIVGMKDQDKKWQNIYDVLAEGNQIWCKNAPILMLLVTKKTFTHNQKPNQWSDYDLGQAAAYISIQALTENIFVHQMGGFSASKARELFSIPEDFEPKTAMALGYPGHPDMLPDDLKKSELAPRKRRKLNELVLSQQWGQDFDIISD